MGFQISLPSGGIGNGAPLRLVEGGQRALAARRTGVLVEPLTQRARRPIAESRPKPDRGEHRPGLRRVRAARLVGKITGESDARSVPLGLRPPQPLEELARLYPMAAVGKFLGEAAVGKNAVRPTCCLPLHLFQPLACLARPWPLRIARQLGAVGVA